MDHMPSQLLLMGVTPSRPRPLEATPSSNSSMGPPMVSRPQVSRCVLLYFNVVLHALITSNVLTLTQHIEM